MLLGMRTLALTLALLLLPVYALAEEPEIRAIPEGTDKIVAVKEGEKAPFSGQLFESATALRWANWLAQYKLHLDGWNMYQNKLNDLDTRYWDKRLVIVDEARKAEQALYLAKINDQQANIVSLTKQVQDPPFYKTTWFGFLGGVVVTGVAVGLGTAVILSAK